MAFLEISDIKNSITHPILIMDEFIKKGTFELRPNGEPKMYSGGFTSVFPCVICGEKWAFRCWHKDLGNLRRRFQKLQYALEAVPMPYLADFKYVDEGIVVNGNIYPTTRMRWIDGLNIKEYIYKYRKDKTILNKLGDSFLEMCKMMHKNSFAHGDLQHGNIIVGKDDKLYLIDYDSLYHPLMGDMSDIIIGLKDYQHPQRYKIGKATEKLDYFSELVIYTCIKAVATDSNLADLYELENSESLLFTAEDFTDIKNSQLIQTLREKDQYLNVLCEILEEYLSHSDINELRPIEQMLDIMLGVPEITSLTFDNGEVYEGDTVHLRWTANNALTQRVNNLDIKSSVRHYRFRAKLTTTQVQLTISNYLHTSSASANILVHPLARIEFSCDKSLIRKGKNNIIELKWRVEKAQSVEIKDEQGKILSTLKNGQKIIELIDSKRYILSAIGNDGHRVFTKEVVIEAAYESVVQFSVDKHFTLPGVPVTATWSVMYADEVYIEPKGVVAHQGSYTIEPNRDTKLLMRVNDRFGTQTYEHEIRILPLPVVKLKPQYTFFKNETSIRASFVRPQAQIITPKVFSMRAIPFVPRLKIRTESPELRIGLPKFIGLNIEYPHKELSTWKSLINLFNKLFSTLKDKIQSYEYGK